MIGQTIATYRIEALLGEGGMGSVYRAVDINLGRPVALKLMHPHLARQPEFRARFIQEARSSANLSHPSIVRIYQFEARGDLMFIAMEYFPGGTLTSHLKHAAGQKQSIDLRETLAILAQIADALDYAHRKGIVHRDIKPDNILLANLEQPERPGEPALRAVVTDFGLARLRTAGAVQTQDGTFMGTLPYMSPEQCLGKDLDGRSDIYALGVMLYQMTTNRLPFEVQSPSDALMKHINEPPPPPRQFSPNLPEIVASIILKCLAKDPNQRFATAADLAAALRSAGMSLTEDQVTAYTPPATAIHLNTQLMPGGPTEQRGQSVFAQAGAVPNARQDRIQVTNSSGATGRLTPITKNSLVIGRDRDCDLTLDDNRASRKHARIDFDGRAYTITDLNSTNGTFLSGARLLPGIAEAWPYEKVLQIGDSYLRIVPSQMAATGAQTSAGLAAPVGPANPAGGTATAAYVTGSVGASITGRVSMNLGQSELSVEAGQPVSVVVTLFNQGSIVDHFQLLVEGIAPAWLPAAPPLVQLMPGAQQQITLTFQPPRSPQARAGSYPVTLRAASQDNPNQVVSARLTLIVRPYSQFSTELFPQRVRSGRPARLTVKNTGNSAQTFLIDWSDRGDELSFQPQQVQLPVGEGQAAVVEFRAKPKQGIGNAFTAIGGEKVFNFNTRITSPQGDQQSQSGELVSRALVPMWLIPILVSLCLCLGILGGGALAANAGLLPFLGSATPTITPGVTGQTTLDTDSDGLPDLEEQKIGTNINDPDTDKDGISDFIEVQKGLNPLKPDLETPTTNGSGDQLTPVITPTITDTPAPNNPLVVKLVKPNAGDYQPALDELVFQVIAYDPTAGFNDGDGIKAVDFEIRESGGGLVYQNTENSPGYCAFEGGEPDCNVLSFIRQNKQWPNGAAIFNGDYKLTATAHALDGRSANVEFPFSIKRQPSRAVYTSDRNGSSEIFVRDLESGQETNLTNNTSAYDNSPAWSPDGRFIAFQTFRDGNNEIYVMDANGGNVRNFTSASSTNETDPAWSADGQWLAYTSDRTGSADIFITNFSDGSTFQVTYDGDSDYQPAFSPDGKYMAFVSTRGNSNPGIYVMDFDLESAKSGLEGHYTQFYATGDSAYNPDWSPDSRFLAFAAGGVGDANIYIMEAGGSPVAVTDSSFYEYEPVWMPDGKQLVYTRTESFGGLFIVSADGSQPRSFIESIGYGNSAADILP